MPELEEIDDSQPIVSGPKFKSKKATKKKFKPISDEELEVVEPSFYNFCSTHQSDIVYVYVYIPV